MAESQYRVVFKKLSEASADDTALVIICQTMASELDEMSELRRVALEVREPEPVSYTTT